MENNIIVDLNVSTQEAMQWKIKKKIHKILWDAFVESRPNGPNDFTVYIDKTPAFRVKGYTVEIDEGYAGLCYVYRKMDKVLTAVIDIVYGAGADQVTKTLEKMAGELEVFYREWMDDDIDVEVYFDREDARWRVEVGREGLYHWLLEINQGSTCNKLLASEEELDLCEQVMGEDYSKYAQILLDCLSKDLEIKE